MDPDDIRQLLEAVSGGRIAVDSAMERLARLPFENLGHARLDHHRALRHGFPEVVLGQGKSPEQFAEIVAALALASGRVVGTRVPPELAQRAMDLVPDATYHATARMLVIDRSPLERVRGVAIVSGGTSDMPVAEEAALTAETMGNHVDRFYDVGVAGLHRLLAVLPELRRSRAVVAVAGMEGALPGVVAGLLSVPVIAVPTSVGYGANLGGVAALLTMLNSCSSGVSVVNIDNGFGAGTIASMINRDGKD